MQVKSLLLEPSHITTQDYHRNLVHSLINECLLRISSLFYFSFSFLFFVFSDEHASLEFLFIFISNKKKKKKKGVRSLYIHRQYTQEQPNQPKEKPTNPQEPKALKPEPYMEHSTLHQMSLAFPSLRGRACITSVDGAFQIQQLPPTFRLRTHNLCFSDSPILCLLGI
jgi:hypothetical protein